jgi:hypothetical protein|tara:strand:- start:561 stop:758 length:198 start_codon:yes stop_codon:yes gene_type:complete
MSNLLYSDESYMLKQAVCKLMEVSLELGDNRGSALNGEFKKVDDLLSLINRVKNNMERKNEHIRI